MTHTVRRKRFRLSPIENEDSFRQLQEKHGHLVQNVRALTIDPNALLFNRRRVKERPRFLGFLPEKEVLSNDDTGSQANFLVHPNKNIPDKPEEIPEFIFPVRHKKHRGYDTVSRIIENVDKRGSHLMKERQQKQTERTVVDTLIADYLCNHNYGHVIPVYEGTGLQTCACCTDRNRENVRSMLGLPPDRDHTVPVKDKSPWFSTKTNNGQDIKVNVYPLGSSQKTQAQPIKLDPSAFRHSDTRTRVNWASSATFELPDFYKEQLTRSYPEYGSNRNTQTHHHTLPTIDKNYPNNGANNYGTRILPDYNAPKGNDTDSLSNMGSNPKYISDRITSANKKYNSAMGNLTRFRFK